MRIVGTILVLSWIVNARAADLPAGFTPVLASRVTGGSLVVPEGNCQAPTPTDGTWRWYQKPESERIALYLCRNELSGEMLTLSSLAFPTTVIGPAFRERMLASTREIAAAGGGVLVGPIHKPARQGTGKGEQVTYHLRKADGSSVYLFTYTLPTGYVCTVTMGAQTDAEPTPFTFVAGGLRPIKTLTTEDLFPELASISSPFSYLMFGSVAFCLASGFGLVRRRRVNQWTFVMCALVILAALNIATLRRSDALEDLAVEDRNHMVRRSFVWPLLALGVAHFLRIQRRQRLRADA